MPGKLSLSRQTDARAGPGRRLPECLCCCCDDGDGDGDGDGEHPAGVSGAFLWLRPRGVGMTGALLVTPIPARLGSLYEAFRVVFSSVRREAVRLGVSFIPYALVGMF